MIFRRRDPFPNLPARPADSHRCLLVAHECPPTPNLCRLMEEKCQRGPCEMHVLVSRFRRSVLVTDPALTTRAGDDRITLDDQAWDVAEARLDSFMRALGGLGQPLTGEILSGNVLRKVRDHLRWDDFDEVVIMAPGRRRRWPSRDLADRVRRSARVPVTLIAADDLAA
jgi:hypothetical protein